MPNPDEQESVRLSLFEGHLLILMRHVVKAEEAAVALARLKTVPNDPPIQSFSIDSIPSREQLLEMAEENTFRTRHDSFLHYLRQSGESSMIAVVFAAFTLEAYINDITSTYLPEIVQELDREPTAEKWLKIPTIAFGKGLAKSDNRYRQIKELFQLRDRIVHAKPVEIDGTKKMKEVRHHFLSFRDAEKAGKACMDAIRWIQEVLPDDRCALPDIGERVEEMLRWEMAATVMSVRQVQRPSNHQS